MSYSNKPNFNYLGGMITEYARLADEYKAKGVQELIDKVTNDMNECIEKLKNLEPDKDLRAKEPDKYEEILKLRPEGPRKLSGLTIEKYREKLKGAFMSRMAGCTLGAPVEAWTVEQMEDWAKFLNIEYPVKDYWPAIKNPNDVRYIKSIFDDYTKPKLDHVPCDDDTNYTLLGLLVAEEKGIDFTTYDVGEVWKKYVTMAYSAEYMGWTNFCKGIEIDKVGEYENPYVQWLGADIRCDPFGYIAAGNPELAAKLAYTDAYLTHRRNGIYSAMFFAASIAAAFVVDDPIEAMKIGLTEIPAECEFANAVKWALETAPSVKDYKDGYYKVKEKFGDMSIVHSNNNAALSIFGIVLGGRDIGKAFSNTVAMAMDNDCTAATTGSLAGAAYGIDALDEHWYKPFNNKFRTYFNGQEYYEIDDLLNRFEKLYLKTL